MPSTRALRRLDTGPPPPAPRPAAAAPKKQEKEEEGDRPWSQSSSSSSSASAPAKHSAAPDAAARAGSGARVYPLRDFPGSDAAALGGAFRDNVRWLLKQWGPAAPGSALAWRALLSDDRTGALVPILAVEEVAAASPEPLCDLCRCAG